MVKNSFKIAVRFSSSIVCSGNMLAGVGLEFWLTGKLGRAWVGAWCSVATLLVVGYWFVQ